MIIDISIKPRQLIELNDLETKVKNARNTNDYILVHFGRKGEFIKVAFNRDQTYTIGYNFINIEFMTKTNVMIKQYPKTVVSKIALYLFTWINRLNR